MKGIDKGDIISSGAPQNSKEGSTGRSPNEYAQSRRTKHGTHFLWFFIIVLKSFIC